MKRLITVLLLICLSGSSIANTIFKCETDRGTAELEKNEHYYVFDLQMSTCMLHVNTISPIVNRGQGYDSWELPLVSKSQLCSYAIEFVDTGNMQQYSVVQFANGQRIESVCRKDSIVDNVLNNPQ